MKDNSHFENAFHINVFSSVALSGFIAQRPLKGSVGWAGIAAYVMLESCCYISLSAWGGLKNHTANSDKGIAIAAIAAK